MLFDNGRPMHGKDNRHLFAVQPEIGAMHVAVTATAATLTHEKNESKKLYITLTATCTTGGTLKYFTYRRMYHRWYIQP